MHMSDKTFIEDRSLTLKWKLEAEDEEPNSPSSSLQHTAHYLILAQIFCVTIKIFDQIWRFFNFSFLHAVL